MKLQGQSRKGGFTHLFQSLHRAILLTFVALGLVACSSQVQEQTTIDYSNLDAATLLDVFLKNERSRGTVKFVFTGDIEVKAGGSHHFRGVAGYESCSALRIKLLGPVGFTLLEYLYADGHVQLIVDEISPDGDKEARAGLLSLMEVFTLALLERCQPAADFSLDSLDAATIEFLALSRMDQRVNYTLDRKEAALTKQTIVGAHRTQTVVAYGEYGWVDGNWMPGHIEIYGPDMPVTIKMQIDRWTMGADLPRGFFTEE